MPEKIILIPNLLEIMNNYPLLTFFFNILTIFPFTMFIIDNFKLSKIKAIYIANLDIKA